MGALKNNPSWKTTLVFQIIELPLKSELIFLVIHQIFFRSYVIGQNVSRD